jgi:hypothetical protein
MTASLTALQVNVFRGSHRPTPVKTLSLAQALDAIRTGIYQRQVAHLRHLLASQGEKVYKRLKEQLDAVTFCGTFSPSRAKANLTHHNGIVHGDLDHLPDLHAVKLALCADPYTVYCFVSPRGEGLKLGVRIEPVPDDAAYKPAWQAVADYYRQHYGVTWDPSGKDVSRLCYVSWDAECYINPEAPLFPVPLMVAPPPRPQMLPRPRDIPSDRRERYAQQAIDTAVKIIDASIPGTRHHARTKAAYLLGGYVAGGLLDYHEAYPALEAAVSRNTDTLTASLKTITDCLQAGMDAAISLEDLEAERERWLEAHRTMSLPQQQTNAYQRRLAARVAHYKQQLYADPYLGAPERRGKGIPAAVLMYDEETLHD